MDELVKLQKQKLKLDEKISELEREKGKWYKILAALNINGKIRTQDKVSSRMVYYVRNDKLSFFGDYKTLETYKDEEEMNLILTICSEIQANDARQWIEENK